MKNKKIYIIFLLNIIWANQLLDNIYIELGIDVKPKKDTIINENSNLISIGKNHLGKEIFLSKQCANSWMKMQLDAKKDSIDIFILSGFRSYQAQCTIIKNKIKKGMKLGEILKENKLPGLSQHHSGNAIDIVSNGYKLSVEFEKNIAYKWLIKNANKYGFYLTYPKNNAENLMFEPWHWYFKE